RSQLPVQALPITAADVDVEARVLVWQLVVDVLPPAHVSGQLDPVRDRHGLPRLSTMRIGIFFQAEDGIRDAVADLIGVPFGHGFAREKIRPFPGQGAAPSAGHCGSLAVAALGRQRANGRGSWASPTGGSRTDWPGPNEAWPAQGAAR